MARKIVKKLIPHPSRIKDHKILKKLGPMLQNPNIWHINRRSVSGAMAVGLFCAFVPLPFQMLIAALGAILFRVNILIAVPTVWISNPVTIAPMFYFCYLIGARILDTQLGEFHFELSFDWLATELGLIWQPFLLGCFIVASLSAFIGFLLVRLLWRLQIVLHIAQRKKRIKQ